MIWVAPFLGEFGWETTIWSPWLRHEQDRLNTEFHVLCEKGKRLLYDDFAVVTELEWEWGYIRDCNHAITPQGAKLGKPDYVNYCTKAAGHGVKCIAPTDLKTTWPGGTPQAKHSKFKSYREPYDEPRNLIAIHARQAQHRERNWSEENWAELVDKLKFEGYHVISTGSVGSSLHVKGTENCRGIDLDQLARLLSGVDAIVGPSSGPMAFAMLCETPVVWWSQNRKDEQRFIKTWNPFGVQTHRVAPNWCPTVGEVLRVCRRF